MMDDFTDFRVISAAEFEALPGTEPRRRSPAVWDPVLDALELGDAVRIPHRAADDPRFTADDLARRAGTRGIAIEIRTGQGFVAARKTDDETTTLPVPIGSRRFRGN
jgi:hypothetical protein